VFGVGVPSFWHIHALDDALEAEEHPGAEVTAVSDEDGEQGRMEVHKRGVPFHDDLEGLLCREGVDGVVLTTPTVAHREVIPAAARAGEHIFAEKVIAPNPRIPNTTLSRPSAAATCQPLHLRPNFVERLLHVLQLAG
jgi:1,5-anhydro-D-fructose reductase (1,5-anhydro-D-mannitol-forming)